MEQTWQGVGSHVPDRLGEICLAHAASVLKPFAQRNSIVFGLAFPRPDKEGKRN
jgi:hypothetical protein